MPAQTPEEPQGIREERRRQILDAALIVFAQKGFHDANVSDVAALAGVSQGTIYWYFESKEALMRELMADAFAEVLQPLAEILARADLSPLARLLQSFRTSLTLFRDHSERFKILLGLWTQPSIFAAEAGGIDLLDSLYQQAIFEPFNRLIQEGMAAGEIVPGDSEALTVAISALLDGLMLYSLVWPEGLVSDERLEAVFLRLLQSPPQKTVA